MVVRLHVGHGDDRLGSAVLMHLEVVRSQRRHVSPVLVGDDGVELHQRDAEAEDGLVGGAGDV